MVSVFTITPKFICTAESLTPQLQNNHHYCAHLWYVLGVNTVYGVSHILFGRHNETEGKHAGGGDAVVEPEHPAVDVHVRDVEQPP